MFTGWIKKLHKRGLSEFKWYLTGLVVPLTHLQVTERERERRMCAPHLREKLIVVVLQDPHFSLQLPDVVGGGIWRREGEEKRGGEEISISKTSSGKQAGRTTGAKGPHRAPKVTVHFERPKKLLEEGNSPTEGFQVMVNVFKGRFTIFSSQS